MRTVGQRPIADRPHESRARFVTTSTSPWLWVVTALATIAWSAVIYRGTVHGLPGIHQVREIPLMDLKERLRDGGVFLHNGNVYQYYSGLLENTNPPFTILVYLPLHPLGFNAAGVIMNFVSFVSVSAVVAICTSRLTSWSLPFVCALSTSVTAPAYALICGVMWKMLVLGQIRAVLMALVVVDLLVVPSKAKGWLIGLAGALSLTPLAFIIIVGMMAGRRGVGRCLASFASFSLLGLIIGVGSWTNYWFHLLPDGQQQRWVTKCNTLGCISRIQADLHAIFAGSPLVTLPGRSALLIVVEVLVAVAGVVSAYLLLQEASPIAAICVFGVSLLLVEPVSWDHYWIWTLLAVFAGLEVWRRSTIAAIAFFGLFITVTFIDSFGSVVHIHGLSSTAVRHVITWAGLIAVIAVFAGSVRISRSDHRVVAIPES